MPRQPRAPSQPPPRHRGPAATPSLRRAADPSRPRHAAQWRV